MKLTKLFLFLCVAFSLIYYVYSAEAPAENGVCPDDDITNFLINVYILAELSFTLRLILECLAVSGYDISNCKAPGELLDKAAMSMEDTLLEVVQEECYGEFHAKVNSQTYHLVNDEVKECIAGKKGLSSAVLGFVVTRLGDIYDGLFRGSHLDHPRFNGNLLLQTRNTYGAAIDLNKCILATLEFNLEKYTDYRAVIDQDRKKREEDKQREIMFKNQEKSSNLAAHLLIGCCKDGSCDSLDSSRKKEKSSKKRNRGGRKRREMKLHLENNNEQVEEAKDDIQDEEGLNAMLLEAVELVNKAVAKLLDISKLEQKLTDDLLAFNQLVDKLEKTPIHNEGGDSNNLSGRLTELFNQNRKVPQTDPIGNNEKQQRRTLRLMARSILPTSLEDNKQEHLHCCHHTKHACKGKNKSLIQHPD
ncbi:hypothetical protein OJ252_1044 [Cryptosporidium canis]|uniref:Signal peptide-containing protein n=1 Tax=Cryptosporidium canis TaxID=195482 RepID=A0ABQ8P9I5_9CRYT|nr:hypothetical protein OJ252_1044 [Cryptosporidium canis]